MIVTDGRPVRVLIATTNPAKAERLENCLVGWAFDSYGPEAVSPTEPPEESGSDHREVAETKAKAWSEVAGGLAIASDGGLVIPALGEQWDSLTTRRSAGEDATDEDRVRNLLRLMELYDGEDRQALWQEAVVLADRGDVVATWETKGPIGLIQRAPATTRIDGFWAASLWYFPEVGKVYTELSADELRQVGDPWTRLADTIQEWLRDGGWKRLASI